MAVGEEGVEKAGVHIHKRSHQFDNIGVVETAEDLHLLAQSLALLKPYGRPSWGSQDSVACATLNGRRT
jgi:hypothetical protein